MKNLHAALGRSAAATATVILMLTGCGTEDADLASELEETEDQAIVQGIQGGGNGTVELGVGCSGSLIGTHMVVTAAHCFDDLMGSGSDATVSTRVSWAGADGTWRCMTGSPAVGKCTENRFVRVHRLTGSRPEQDLAAVFPDGQGNSWSNVTADNALGGLYDGPINVGAPYTFWGRGYDNPNGTGNRVMRYMTDTIDGVKPDYLITNADNIRVCKGDSGGPYLLRDSGQWQFGIQSTAVLGNSACAPVGKPVQGSRITPFKRNAINLARIGEGLPACTERSPSFWVCS